MKRDTKYGVVIKVIQYLGRRTGKCLRMLSIHMIRPFSLTWLFHSAHSLYSDLAEVCDNASSFMTWWEEGQLSHSHCLPGPVTLTCS